ncbi:MAG: DUF3810 domain-containing protein [Marinifilaceae bacterium]|nr:DUF3810 domain-containing protein [Marinifilaceae bacterium]
MGKVLKYKKFIIAILLIGIVELFKRVTFLTDLYTDHIYPVLFKLLHNISGVLPFSIYDVLVVAAILLLASGICFIWFRRYRSGYLKTILLSLMWIYIWFYFGWGINYFGKDFYERSSIEKAKYDSLQYDTFVHKFCDSLNSTYSSENRYMTGNELRIEVYSLYDTICSKYNLPTLPENFSTKEMLFPRIYAAVGVTGYYGPLLAEVHHNSYLLPVEEPFTMAHETAHLLGITSEAEANLYAYLVTTSSQDRATRFSGYFQVMPYILNNYRKSVNDSTYRILFKQIKPEIMDLYKEERNHWNSLKVERANSVQNVAHNTYLKINNIPQGITNYSEVVALILSVYTNTK